MLVTHLTKLLPNLCQAGLGLGLPKSGEIKDDASEKPSLTLPRRIMKPNHRATTEQGRDGESTSLTRVGEAAKPRLRPLLDYFIGARSGKQMDDSAIASPNNGTSGDGKLPENSQHIPPDGEIPPPMKSTKFYEERTTKDNQAMPRCTTNQDPPFNERGMLKPFVFLENRI